MWQSLPLFEAVGKNIYLSFSSTSFLRHLLISPSRRRYAGIWRETKKKLQLLLAFFYSAVIKSSLLFALFYSAANKQQLDYC
jgi:hypothetical protein